MKKTILVLLILSTSLFSVTMIPLMQTVKSKKSKHMIFTVNNPSKEPVAVDFSVMRLLDTNNNKEKKEATTKVSVYPTIFTIPAGGNQKVRVRYMGSSLPEIEEVYRVVATEMDINLKDENNEGSKSKVSAQIKIRFSYAGLLFVRKNGAEPQLEIVQFERVPMGGLKVEIKNIGKASDVPNANRYEFIVKIQDKLYKLTEEDLKKSEFRRVLAGKTNTFFLKNAKLPSGKIESIKLELK